MRYRDLAMSGAKRLHEGGLVKLEAARDARLLLQHVAGFDRAQLLSRENELAPAAIVAGYEAALIRRAEGEPVSRIIGEKEFFGLHFRVTPDVLDPRPETELLVERVLKDQADHGARLRFSDIGTGSGAIAVALLANLPAACCVAVDVSPEALEISASNAELHGVAARFERRLGNYVEGLEGPFDFIVSNPPYIRTSDIAELSREVRGHDPRAALDGGVDGLDAYRALLMQSGALLKPGGRLYLEIGAGQSGPVGELANAHGWQIDDVTADLAGIDRVVVARKP